LKGDFILSEKYVSIYYQSEPCSAEVDLDPKRTALLIVDMQNQFILRDFGDAIQLKELGEWDKWIPFHDRLDNIVIPNTKKLLDFFRNNDMEVTYGRIACQAKCGKDRSPVQRKEGWNDILLPHDSFAAQMIDELAPIDGEIVVNKTTDSVVSGTNYAQVLRNMKISSVVVTGIVTDQCVSSTVRSLADEGFDVVVVDDCCAAATDEMQTWELTIINKIYCEILGVDEVIEHLSKKLKLT
jgi:biuret amidohydrolase